MHKRLGYRKAVGMELDAYAWVDVQIKTDQYETVMETVQVSDIFLGETGMKFVWLVDAEKEIHAGDYFITKWSDWEAVFTYERDAIAGEIHRLQGKEN